MLDTSTVTEASEKAVALRTSLLSLHEKLSSAGVELEPLAVASDVADEIVTLLGGTSLYADWGV